MSSLNHQHQIYQIPHQPSPQLKVVLDYFDCLKTWDFERITKLFAPYYSQKTLPTSLSVPGRSKSEDMNHLHTLRDLLKGAPLETDIYDINESTGKIWIHMFVKPVNIEGIFNFTFGAGKDEKLIVGLTEFVDSKVYSGGDNSSDSDGDGRSSNLNGQPEPEPISQLQSDLKTQIEAPST